MTSTTNKVRFSMKNSLVVVYPRCNWYPRSRRGSLMQILDGTGYNINKLPRHWLGEWEPSKFIKKLNFKRFRHSPPKIEEATSHVSATNTNSNISTNTEFNTNTNNATSTTVANQAVDTVGNENGSAGSETNVNRKSNTSINKDNNEVYHIKKNHEMEKGEEMEIDENKQVSCEENETDNTSRSMKRINSQSSLSSEMSFESQLAPEESNNVFLSKANHESTCPGHRNQRLFSSSDSSLSSVTSSVSSLPSDSSLIDSGYSISDTSSDVNASDKESATQINEFYEHEISDDSIRNSNTTRTRINIGTSTICNSIPTVPFASTPTHSNSNNESNNSNNVNDKKVSQSLKRKNQSSSEVTPQETISASATIAGRKSTRVTQTTKGFVPVPPSYYECGSADDPLVHPSKYPLRRPVRLPSTDTTTPSHNPDTCSPSLHGNNNPEEQIKDRRRRAGRNNNKQHQISLLKEDLFLSGCLQSFSNFLPLLIIGFVLFLSCTLLGA